MILYFDNSATTQTDKRVTDILLKYNEELYFNPSSLHKYSMQVSADIARARQGMARLLHCGEKEIVFTSGGTEADNLAIFGSVRQSCNVVSNTGEHPAVMRALERLEENGYEVRRAHLLPDGRVNTTDLLSKIDSNTCLVSVMHVNNETGAINDIEGIAKQAKQKNARTTVMCDGIQGVGKVELNLNRSGVDLYTMSGHKINATKGIGALYVRTGTRLRPMMLGGGQENGVRSGTENVSAIMGFAEALNFTVTSRPQRVKEYEQYKHIILSKLNNVGQVKVICPEYACPSILTIAFEHIKAQVLQNMLESQDIIVGLGSACDSKKKSSKVMREIGLSAEYLEGVVRISFGIYNTTEQVEQFASALADSVSRLRTIVGVC